jgi:hypothetical protein
VDAFAQNELSAKLGLWRSLWNNHYHHCFVATKELEDGTMILAVSSAAEHHTTAAVYCTSDLASCIPHNESAAGLHSDPLELVHHSNRNDAESVLDSGVPLAAVESVPDSGALHAAVESVPDSNAPLDKVREQALELEQADNTYHRADHEAAVQQAAEAFPEHTDHEPEVTIPRKEEFVERRYRLPAKTNLRCMAFEKLADYPKHPIAEVAAECSRDRDGDG